MNRHAARRLTEKTIIELAARLKQAGNRTAGTHGNPGGVPITIPHETAEAIHALAWDITRGIARAAELTPSPQWTTGPVRVNGEVVA